MGEICVWAPVKVRISNAKQRGVQSLDQLFRELYAIAPDTQTSGPAFENCLYPGAGRAQCPGFGVVLEAGAASRDRSIPNLNVDSGQAVSGLSGPPDTGIDG
jgi:hypothetical protein